MSLELDEEKKKIIEAENSLEDYSNTIENYEMHIKSLRRELDEKLAQAEILELAYSEALRIAVQSEEESKSFADQVIKRTIIDVKNNIELCQKLDKEKEKLEEEVNLYSRFFNELQSMQHLGLESYVSSELDLPFVPLQIKEGNQPNEAVYSIKLVTFVNAKHFVCFGEKQGPLHAHSWQVQIEAHVPSEKEELIAFAKVFDQVKKTMVLYENKVLNEEYPFQRIQPTTENISLYFYNLLEDALAEVGLGLGKVTVWETPTRGIEVANRYREFDRILTAEGLKNGTFLESEPILNPEKEAFREVAAAEEQVHVKSEENTTSKSSQYEQENKWLHPFKLSFLLIAFMLVALFGAVYNQGFIFSGGNHITWNSSSINQLYQAENLYQSIRNGNLLSLFTENWTIGTHITYNLTLPYYLLAILRFFSADIFLAGKYYLAACIFIGAFSWLFWVRYIGLWQSVILSIIWLFWVDNIAFLSQGNLPLVFVANIIPLLLISGLSLLGRKQTLISLFPKILLLQVIALSDPRMAVIFGFYLAFTYLLTWLFKGASGLNTIKGVFVYFCGLMTAAWWLLPIIPTLFFNDTLQGSREFFGGILPTNFHYSGGSNYYLHWEIVVGGAILVCLLTWRSKPAWAKSLAVVGVIFSLFALPFMQTVYLKLPWSQTVSPSDFSGFAAVALLASIAAYQIKDQRNGFLYQKHRLEIFQFIAFSVLLVNASLAFYQEGNAAQPVASIDQESLENSQIWRQALVDLSPNNSSATSYLLANGLGNTGVSWIWQSGVTSDKLTLQNRGLELQYYPYLMRTSFLHGITRLMIKKDSVMRPDDLSSAAAKAGYRLVSDQGNLSLWKNSEQPFMTEKKVNALFIGKQAGLLAMRFPGAEVGYSNYLDDYAQGYLQKYSLIVLSGAEWHIQSRAEKLAVEYAQSGGRLIVDLAGAPKSILSKQPKFLDVYGEPVVLPDSMPVFGQGTSVNVSEQLSPVSDYSSFVPMGLDQVEWSFDYYGNKASVFGYKNVGGARIGFLGANLTKLAVLSGDDSALKFIRKIFDLPLDFEPGALVPLTNFRIISNGYEMSYQSEHALTAIVPVANLKGTEVFLDGMPISNEGFEDLIQLELPAGSHSLKIKYPSSIFKVQDIGISLLALVLVIIVYSVKAKKVVAWEEEGSLTTL